MKIVKIISQQINSRMNDKQIREFIYKNLTGEMIRGLEYDDPKTIDRALKLLGLTPKPKKEEPEQQLEELPPASFDQDVKKAANI